MIATVALCSLSLLAAVAQPASVPASGKQESIIRIDEPGMYRISARSEFGTACALVDHFRGPFAQSGLVGKSNCELDLLLDSGRYKLRLESPEQARGQVSISVAAFREIAAPIKRLEQGRSDSVLLKAGEQASWWLSQAERRHVTLTIIGRTAGVVRLWKDGKWVEELPAERQELTPREGQPIYRWTLSGVLEQGDYLLTAYGADPRRWSEGQPSDQLFVSHGFAAGSADRVQGFSLPAWGWLAVQAPAEQQLAAFLSADRAPEGGALRMELLTLHDQPGERLGSVTGACQIPPKALIPECTALSQRKNRHVIILSGPPGSTGQLRWAEMVSGSYVADGLYARAAASIAFDAPKVGGFFSRSAEFWLSTDDVPLDPDEPPLACVLESTGQTRVPLAARDLMSIGPEQAYERAFNYDGREAAVAFRVLKADSFEIRSGAERGLRCELFAGSSGRMDRLTETRPDAKQCLIDRHLPPGDYTLKLFGGNSGIAELRIRPRSAGERAVKVTKNSCRFGRVKLESQGKYRVRFSRSGRVAARGLVLRELPLRFDRVLPLVVDAGESVELPIRAGEAIEVRAAGSGAFLCGYGQNSDTRSLDGRCRLPATKAAGNLRIHNPGTESLVLSVARPKDSSPAPALSEYRPDIQSLPSITTGQARFFDFERNQSHSVVFDVEQAGLVHLTTEGLLSTSCRVRTPIVTRLAENAGGGRGRNCLVSQYLRPGRYLLTVQTQGSSRGRGALLVSPRPVKQELGLAGPGEVFFRAPAEALLRQKIEIKEPGRYRLSTGGQNVDLQCRLEDEDGWPLVRVPGSCEQQLELEPGVLLWSQLPLTVESMRRTRLELLTEREILRGEVVHELRLNKPVELELSADGKDEFVFELPAELDMQAYLDQGMQGRIMQAAPGGKAEVLALIKPDGGRQSFKLKAGSYQLETEHSRADRGIRYQLHLSADLLAPGLNRNLPVPGSSRVLVPESGVVRIGSAGSTDVRCRLFDAGGKLVAESEDLGADWNCLFAVPLSAGEYRLELEAQNKTSGMSEIRMRMPPVRSGLVLTDGQQLSVGKQVVVAGLPPPEPGRLQEVGFSSRLRFSCALEDADGQVLQRHLDVLRCGFLLNPQKAEHKVRLWTRRWQGSIKTKMVSRSIERFSSGRLQAGKAGRVRIERAGLYATAKKIWCAPADRAGPLEFCGDEASLEEGEHIFSTTGPEDRPRLALEPRVAALDKPLLEDVWLDENLRMQRQTSERKALHLFALRLPPGLPHPPACRLDGGVAQQGERACFAVAGPTGESLARFWLPDSGRRRAQLERRAVSLPAAVGELGFGIHSLLWDTGVARYRLPEQAARVELVLPHLSWAARADASGRLQDFCPPTEGLSHCVLGGAGGELLLVSDSERRARLRLLRVDERPGQEALTGLLERWNQSAGRARLSIQAAAGPRALVVEGAQRCLLSFDDGSRLLGCRQTLPAGASAELILDHPAGPLWAALGEPGAAARIRWPQPLPPGPPALLPQAQADKLEAAGLDRLIELSAESLVSVQADSGVCALWRGSDLLEVAGEAGCKLQRVLGPGSYRLMVRPFAHRPLSGRAIWTAQGLRRLGEGVGMQEWAAPGETRAFRFATRARGRLGVGLQADSDALRCAVYAAGGRLMGEGCHQFLELEAGDFLLTVSAPAEAAPMRFRPVVLGLSGDREEIPEDYLRDFFKRIGFENGGGGQ